MIEEHPIVAPPANADALLWRYMSVDRVCELLASRELYFCRVDLLGDPFEGSFPADQHAMRRKLYAGVSEQQLADFSRQAEESRKLAYASCWHIGDHESEHMWHRYGGNSVALVSSIQRLRAGILDTTTEFLLSAIHYTDFSKGWIRENYMFNSLFTKRLEFRDDREFRLMKLRIDLLGPEAGPPPDGERVPIDPAVIVDRVVLHPRLGDDDVARVRAALDAAGGLADRAVASSLSGTPRF